jgi:hypothetical protein
LTSPTNATDCTHNPAPSIVIHPGLYDRKVTAVTFPGSRVKRSSFFCLRTSSCGILAQVAQYFNLDDRRSGTPDYNYLYGRKHGEHVKEKGVRVGGGSVGLVRAHCVAHQAIKVPKTFRVLPVLRLA